jgi:SRSO17 transposase
VDETGFLKKGEKSAGVQRQYSGTAGKTENCQLGVFLTYATTHGHAFLDRRLYLPENWCADAQRCAEAKIPEDVVFATKPQQALEMLRHAWALGVPMRWVTGDEVYGEAAYLRDAVAESGRWYVLAVRVHSTVWPNRPEVAVPAWSGIGRKPEKARVVDESAQPLPIPALVAAWPESQWHRLEVAEGEKGPRVYDWACQRVVENQDQLPGRDAWLVARRALHDPADVAYYLSNAPAETALLTLAQVASTRYTIEQCIEEGKGETGLDHYEVRYWHSWYRHITLSMMAHAWLASVRLRRNQEKGGVNPFSPN